MFFLLRMTFWISLVFVLLPSGGAKQTTVASNTGTGARDVVSASSATGSNIRHFCTRQPDACAIGSQAASAIRQRAQAGARIVYDFIHERAAARDAASTASKPTRPATASNPKASQDTLSGADVAPAWRGAHREVHNRHGA